MIAGRLPVSAWRYGAEVAASSIGVLLAIGAAWQWGSALAAVAAGASAALTGAFALQDNPHARAPQLAIVALSMGAAVVAGGLTFGDGTARTAAGLVLMALWCAGAGMLWAVGSYTGLVGAATAAILVITAAMPTDAETVLTAAGFAIFAGLSQTVVALWPRPYRRVRRHALAAAYRAVAEDARRRIADPQSRFDVTSLIALREQFTPTDRQARRQPPRYPGLYGLPERIAMTLTALPASQATDTLTAAADVLSALSGGGTDGHGTATEALKRLDAARPALPTQAATVGQRLATQLREAVEHRFRAHDGVRPSLRQVRRQVAAACDTDSPIARHAARLSIACTAATALFVVGERPHGYWIALTVLLVLRPETAHTYTRCIVRVVATAIGVGAVTAGAVLVPPAPLVSALLAVALVAVAYSVAGLGYVPLSALLAGAISFLVDLGAPADPDAVRNRVLAVLAGGALAVCMHVLLPDGSLVRLRPRAGELLHAEIDYATTVIRGFVHRADDPTSTTSAAWQRTLRARSAFEAASGSARADSPHVRGWLARYRAALNAVTGACTTLETHIGAARQGDLDPRFTVAVDDYIDALRAHTPSAGQAWTVDITHLVAADQQLRESAALLGHEDTAQRVLVGEIDAITRQLLRVAEHPL